MEEGRMKVREERTEVGMADLAWVLLAASFPQWTPSRYQTTVEESRPGLLSASRRATGTD